MGYTLLRVCLSLVITFPYRFCPRICVQFSVFWDNFHQFSTRAVYMYSNGVGGGERGAI